MNEAQMQEWLEKAVVFRAQGEGIGMDVMSFSTAGLLTQDKGIVLRIKGSEFQISIIQSR